MENKPYKRNKDKFLEMRENEEPLKPEYTPTQEELWLIDKHQSEDYQTRMNLYLEGYTEFFN